MGIFYWEKAFHAWKKYQKKDFAPSEKYAYNAPDVDMKINHKQVSTTVARCSIC